jgi:hypothetical protein
VPGGHINNCRREPGDLRWVTQPSLPVSQARSMQDCPHCSHIRLSNRFKHVWLLLRRGAVRSKAGNPGEAVAASTRRAEPGCLLESHVVKRKRETRY